MRAEGPTAGISADGRLRLVHGPIDLVVAAEGGAERVQAAYRRAHVAFVPVLTALVGELPRLRSPHGPDLSGAVARRMQAATDRFAPVFVTPMAAVAGSVADHVLAAMLKGAHGLTRAHVNNGGDIALWTSDRPLVLAICEDPVTGAAGAQAAIGAGDGIGGVATSGWRGRSHSLGIADAVTVLARDAATADAAATLIANAVDLPGHPGIARAPARDLSPDSDLGDLPVTTDVAPLTPQDLNRALDRGMLVAQDYIDRGLIAAACLAAQGVRRMTGAAIAPALSKDEKTHA
ncbi:UPF0280 family protein [Chachezhania sediminis]|uniref:UPF0280 family protein n=1 Tax=Chachezhania sediminis TaxID=2599291 RepID=UPI00131C686D|nr:UPF0280 family protein [Chachezhania sediminis]